MTKTFRLNIFILSFSLLVTSCASNRISGWFKSDDKIELSQAETVKAQSQAIVHWSKRHIKEELEKAIELYKRLSQSTENNYKFLAKLSRAHYFLADAHHSDMEMKKKIWELGTSFGEKAMAKNTVFSKEMLKEGARVEDHLDLLGKNEIAAMYWTASNLGKWAKNSGIATTLKYKTLIKKLISRVEKLDRTFFYFAPDRYWGAFFAIAPGFAGGDMDQSKIRFERNLKEAPAYLGTKVLFADYYMTKKDDQESFKKLLNEVLASKVMDPNILSENIVEKRKAKTLLMNIEDKF
jgi:hypothetical protein